MPPRHKPHQTFVLWSSGIVQSETCFEFFNDLGKDVYVEHNLHVALKKMDNNQAMWKRVFCHNKLPNCTEDKWYHFYHI